MPIIELTANEVALIFFYGAVAPVQVRFPEADVPSVYSGGVATGKSPGLQRANAEQRSRQVIASLVSVYGGAAAPCPVGTFIVTPSAHVHLVAIVLVGGTEPSDIPLRLRWAPLIRVTDPISSRMAKAVNLGVQGHFRAASPPSDYIVTGGRQESVLGRE